MTTTNKKLEKSIEETFDKMDGIVNETLKTDEKQPTQKINEPIVSGDNKISETSNTETSETNTTGTTTDTGTSEGTSDNSENTIDEGNEISTILEKKESNEIVKEKNDKPIKTVTPTEETVTPPEETVTPPEETVTPPEETVTPPEETVTPPEETVTPPEETVTPDDEFEKEAEYSDMDNLKILLRQTNKYSYLNCGRHLQNSLDNESLKKFYDEFIVLGCTNDVDYKVLNLIEIILDIKTPFLPD